MQRIIQINIAKRLIPIEEDAYALLKEYISSLERHFSSEQGGNEIIEDIENRMAELFTIRLQAGAHSIDREDVRKVIETLGPAYALGAEAAQPQNPYLPARYTQQKTYSSQRRLFRNPKDKVLGGVCSGIAAYFDVDPVLIRLAFVAMFLGLGVGLIAYIISWIVIPVARTPEEIASLNGEPVTFHDVRNNIGAELHDLKRRGEEMSQELRDFFSKKK